MQYDTLNDENTSSFINQISVTFDLALKSLVYSKKWIIYLILSLAPFIFSFFSANKLGVSQTPLKAFISLTMGTQFGFFYVFGVLLLALPFSTDEITDHTLDLFLTRPVSKEVIYFTRYIVLVFANTIINSVLIVFYYLYYYNIDNKDIFPDLGILGGILTFFLIANMLYSALFLGIGFIGSKGFGVGMFVAIIEIFFLNVLFLSNDPLVPRTNLQIIASNLTNNNFSYKYTNTFITGLSNYDNAILYVLVAIIIFLFAGWFFFINRDFD